VRPAGRLRSHEHAKCAFDQNIFTEYHSRYDRRGVLIYWSVEKGSVAIHSQLLNCSASEVHAMVDGAIHHGTDMAVEANYVDTHGQSEIGFGITKLLGFDLLPRIKRINKVKLYRPTAGEAGIVGPAGIGPGDAPVQVGAAKSRPWACRPIRVHTGSVKPHRRRAAHAAAARMVSASRSGLVGRGSWVNASGSSRMRTWLPRRHSQCR
jgi:hypothetical protein